jgi:ribonuclease R
MNDEQLSAWIGETLKKCGSQGLNLKQLLKRSGLARDQRRRLRRVLRALVAEDKLQVTLSGRYRLPAEKKKVDGVVGRRTLSGWRVNTEQGPVQVKGSGWEIASGDRVSVQVEGRGRRGVLRGCISEVLDHRRPPLVGTVYRRGRFTMLFPDDGRREPQVLEGLDRAVADGQVVALIPPQGRGRPRMVEVLGEAGEFDCELRRLELVNGLSRQFPQAVIEEAGRAAEAPDPVPEREDLTDLCHLTIDPDDAKDFDDAICVERTREGYRLLVSIADVASFVPAGGELDHEARRRGCSVYLPGRVFPMLPAVLSEDCCSLAPGLPRRAQTVEMLVDRQGEIYACSFVRSVIRSRARLTYRQVQQVLDGGGGEAAQFEGQLKLAGEVATLLLERLRARGMLDLDLPESHIEVDQQLRPVKVERAERFFSHRLIEVMMIAANEQVAAFMEKNGLPALFRIHPPPDSEKLAIFGRTAAALGEPAAFSEKPHPGELADYLQGLEGKPVRPILSTLLLRSLMQASYCEQCLEHFGLASESYLHFTSPIRRYPDLQVHRLLGELFRRGPRLPAEEEISRPRSRAEGTELAALAEECTLAERRAMEAERQAQSLYHAAFLARRLGEEFSGRVAMVTEFGLFVTLEPWGIDGLVHISGLRDDYYRFQPDSLALVGKRRGRRLAIGDRLRVRLENVRLWPAQIDLSLLEKEQEA